MKIIRLKVKNRNCGIDYVRHYMINADNIKSIFLSHTVGNEGPIFIDVRDVNNNVVEIEANSYRHAISIMNNINKQLEETEDDKRTFIQIGDKVYRISEIEKVFMEEDINTIFVSLIKYDYYDEVKFDDKLSMRIEYLRITKILAGD